VPGSAEAAIVFLALFVPGYLYLAGYRLGRAVTEQRDGINTVAKVIAASTLLAVASWRLGGHHLHDHIRAGTALTTHEATTWRFTLAALIAPGLLGFLAGELVDAAARRAAALDDALRRAAEASRDNRWPARLRRRMIEVVVRRLLRQGPTVWDRTWPEVRRADEVLAVRVTMKSGQELVGLISQRANAGMSPSPRDVYVERVLRAGPDGSWEPTLGSRGAFISGTEIESVEWLTPPFHVQG